jgi:hypothetical protein
MDVVYSIMMGSGPLGMEGVWVFERALYTTCITH